MIEVYKITFRNSIVSSTVGLHNINAHEDEESTFIEHKSRRLRNELFALHVCIAFDAAEMRRIKQALHRENEKK